MIEYVVRYNFFINLTLCIASLFFSLLALYIDVVKDDETDIFVPRNAVCVEWWDNATKQNCSHYE